MKVAVIQADGKWPNLALMKIATWHKRKGDEVVFIDLTGQKFDRIYGSKIFAGGSGQDLGSKLPPGIEALTPDYDLFSSSSGERIGFTSRGCIRNCGFCIVKEKEGTIHEVNRSWLEGAEKVLLLDNNFLASPGWKEKLKWFIDHKTKVCFSQGLDIRLITEENAILLSRLKYYNHTFRGKTLYFAFDDPALGPIIDEKIGILTTAGIKACYLLFYVLVGYNTTLEQDLARVERLKRHGARPFIMIYNNRKDDQRLRDLARWVNLNYYKVVEFKDYIPTRKKFGRYR